MSKSQVIRDFVREHPGATVDAIAEATGLDRRAFVSTLCAQRVKRGEFVAAADGGLTLNADYVMFKKGQGAAAKPARGGGKKVRGTREHLRAVRRAAKKPRRTLADVARKHLAAVAAVAVVPQSLQVTPASHVRTTLRAFEETIDMDSLNSMARAAYQSHCEAVEMLPLLVLRG